MYSTMTTLHLQNMQDLHLERSSSTFRKRQKTSECAMKVTFCSRCRKKLTRFQRSLDDLVEAGLLREIRLVSSHGRVSAAYQIAPLGIGLVQKLPKTSTQPVKAISEDPESEGDLLEVEWNNHAGGFLLINSKTGYER